MDPTSQLYEAWDNFHPEVQQPAYIPSQYEQLQNEQFAWVYPMVLIVFLGLLWWGEKGLHK